MLSEERASRWEHRPHLRQWLTRCYRCPVRGSLLLTRRGEALS